MQGRGMTQGGVRLTVHCNQYTGAATAKHLLTVAVLSSFDSKGFYNC